MRNLDTLRDDMLREWITKNPDQPHPEIRPGMPMCLTTSDGFNCTRARGHAGEHCAHGRLGQIFHRWTTALASSRAVPAPKGDGR